MIKYVYALIGLLLWVSPVTAEPLSQKARAATAVLYTQSLDGGMRMLCTATVFEAFVRDARPGYLLATAAHCVAMDDIVKQKVLVSGGSFFISFDWPEDKIFHPVHVEAAGYQSRGDDFAVLHVYTEEDWTVLEVGDMSKVEVTEDVLNVAAPMGLGLQVITGHISLISLDRPVKGQGLNWQFAMLANLASGPGASGSTIISVKQEKIIGFVVGNISGNPTTVVLPVSRFSQFVQAARTGRYRWF
jgi:hypothetical protein